MQDTIPLRIQRDEVQLLKETLEEPWQSEHRQAMRAWDWEFIIGKCLQQPGAMERVWQITCREAASGEIENLKDRLQAVQLLFDLAIEVVREAQTKAQQFTRTTGHAIEGVAELEQALEALTSMREKHLIRLSLLDHDIIDEARAEQAAGHYPTADAALADLLAARHAARITPSYTDLRRWAEQSPPEPAWFEEGEQSP